MELDKSIAQLGEKLDAWSGQFFILLESEDRPAQGRELLAGIEIVKELDRLKVQGLAAIRSLLNRQAAIMKDERAASLVSGFEFAAKLKAALHDEVLDTDGCNKIVHLMNVIATTLDEIGSGRAALAVLLKHADANVRASAGAYLIDLMPDRVIPTLREIDEKNDGSSADFTAHWALLDWELKHKAPTE